MPYGCVYALFFITDQCEAIQTTFSGTLELSLFRGLGDDLAAYFNVAPPDSSSLFRPANSDEGQNLHVATPDRILVAFAVCGRSILMSSLVPNGSLGLAVLGKLLRP